MSKISLEKFIENTKGTKVDVPWESDGHLKGQCVSLIQQYLVQCLEQPAHARGDAKDWIQSYVNEGLGCTVVDQRKGDILVFPNEAGGYGHIAICIDQNTLYDQNNLRHDNGLAGYGQVFNTDYVTLRPYADLVEETVETPVQEQPNINVRYVNLPPVNEEGIQITSWRVYPLNKKAQFGCDFDNSIGRLNPSKFGGISYELKGYTEWNTPIIETRDFGTVHLALVGIGTVTDIPQFEVYRKA